MSRFGLIVICSLVPLSSYAQSTGWYYGQSASYPGSQNTSVYFVRNPGTAFSLSSPMKLYRGDQFVTTWSPLWSFSTTNASSRAFSLTGLANGTYQFRDGSLPDSASFIVNGGLFAGMGAVSFTNSFSLEFGPEYIGSVFELRTTNGIVVTNGTVTSSGVRNLTIVSTNSFLELFLNGVPVGSNATNVFSEKSDYAWSMGPGMAGSSWRYVDAATGRTLLLGTNGQAPVSSAGALGLASGQTATLQAWIEEKDWVYNGATESWSLQPTGSGYWTNTGFQLSGNQSGVSNYYFAGPTITAPPSTVPNLTNSPGTFPSALRSVTPNYSSGGTTVTNISYTNETGDLLPITVPERQFTVADDGETNVITVATGLLAKVQRGTENWTLAMDRLRNTLNSLAGLQPGGVGQNCSFVIGDFTINLAGSGLGVLREGLKYLVILVGAFASFAQIRRLFEV